MKRNKYVNLVLSFFKDISSTKNKILKKFNRFDKIVFCILLIAVSTYIVLTQFTFELVYDFKDLNYPDIVYVGIILGTIFLLIVFPFILIWLSKFINKFIIKLNPDKKIMKTFLIYFLLFEFILLIVHVFVYPGIMTVDINSQFSQIREFNFNDWHPVLHTLTLFLVTRISGNYAFIIFIQYTIFSLAVAYLISLLRYYGFRYLYLNIFVLLMIFNLNLYPLLMSSLKDIAFLIAVIFMFICFIRIYFSDGKWLFKKRNIFILSIILLLVTVYRHNGLLITLPFLVLMFIYYFRYKIHLLFLCISFLVLFVLVKGPLYGSLDVVYPENQFIEVVGLPMIMMSGIAQENPNGLSDDAKEFMYSIASPEEWQDKYIYGDFNTIKNDSNASFIVNEYEDEFFSIFIESVNNNKIIAMESFVYGTDMVWRLKGEHSYLSDEGLMPVGILNFISHIGLHFLIIIIATFIGFVNKNKKVIVMSIPLIIYNLITMFLLTSNDYRFFLFNIILSLPILFIALSDNKIKIIE